MTTKSVFSALRAPMSPAWVHESPVSRVWHCQHPSKVDPPVGTHPLMQSSSSPAAARPSWNAGPKREPITVVGHAAVISAGEFIQASGEWANDRTHGVQFRARFLKTMPPTTTEGIEKYLGSGMIRGIGPAYARKLLRAFGSQVFDVIEVEPHRLREVAGIGPKRADGIARGWAEQRAIREIMIFLHANGVGTSRAVRIYKTYGADAIQVISEDPYFLAAHKPFRVRFRLLLTDCCFRLR